MRSTLRGMLVIVVVAVMAACAGTANRSTTDAGRSDRLSRTDIGETAYPDLYELILARRGTWLRTRGPDSLGGRSSVLQVYRDNVRLGGVETLRAIHPMEIDYVQFYDPVQASSRWGFDHGAGVIFVATRRD